MKNIKEYNKRIKRIEKTNNKFNKVVNIEKLKISLYETDVISDINFEAKLRAKKRFNNMKMIQCDCCCNVRRSKFLREKYKKTLSEINNTIKFYEEINQII